MGTLCQGAPAHFVLSREGKAGSLVVDTSFPNGSVKASKVMHRDLVIIMEMSTWERVTVEFDAAMWALTLAQYNVRVLCRQGRQSHLRAKDSGVVPAHKERTPVTSESEGGQVYAPSRLRLDLRLTFRCVFPRQKLVPSIKGTRPDCVYQRPVMQPPTSPEPHVLDMHPPPPFSLFFP